MAGKAVETENTSAEGLVTNVSAEGTGAVHVRSDAPKRPKTNAAGVPLTVWDNEANDPTKRTHAGDDPTGETNKIV